MKTRRLFYEDVYIREFEAIVLSCEERQEGYYIILNETAFYPEGGGFSQQIRERLREKKFLMCSVWMEKSVIS